MTTVAVSRVTSSSVANQIDAACIVGRSLFAPYVVLGADTNVGVVNTVNVSHAIRGVTPLHTGTFRVPIAQIIEQNLVKAFGERMAYSAPTHTPQQWHDAPATDTAVDKSHLESMEVDLVDFIRSVAIDVAAYVDDRLGRANGIATLDSSASVPFTELSGDLARWSTLPVKEVTGLKLNSTASGDMTSNYNNITSAFAALDAATGGQYGGVVELPSGLCYVDNTIAPMRRCGVKGQGVDTTTLKMGAGKNKDVYKPHVSTADNDPNAKRTLIRDLTLDGNKGSQSTGHCLTLSNNPAFSSVTADTALDGPDGYDPRHIVTNVLLRNGKQNGFNGDNTIAENRLMNVWALDNDGYGFLCQGDTQYVNCNAGLSGLSGFRMNGASVQILGGKSWYSGRVSTDNDGYGYLFNGASGCETNGCYAQDNANAGFSLVNSSGNKISGFCDSNSQGPQAGSNAITQFAVDMWSAAYNIIDLVCFNRQLASLIDPARPGGHGGLFQSGALQIRQASSYNNIRMSHFALAGAKAISTAVAVGGTANVSNQCYINGAAATT